MLRWPKAEVTAPGTGRTNGRVHARSEGALFHTAATRSASRLIRSRALFGGVANSGATVIRRDENVFGTTVSVWTCSARCPPPPL